MSRINAPDFGAGLLFIAFALYFVITAQGYTLGTAARIGPGFFPTWLGCILGAIGLWLILSSLRGNAEAISPVGFRGLIMVVAAIVFFGIGLRPLGFLLAGAVTVFIAALGSGLFRWRASLLLAGGMSVVSTVVFIKLLGVQMPALPAL
jgi:putative tricarboxylic transport membrane protein